MVADRIKNYSFKYFGVMDDAMKSLPLGNGDIGANVWLTPDGLIHILISKTDSWSELYRLLKVAHIVLSIDPCPFTEGANFDLNIADGVLDIVSGNNKLRIYADALAPCLRLVLNTEKSVDAKVSFVNYRDMPIDPKNDFSNYFVRGGQCNIVESADIITTTPNGGVAQIHRNSQSCYDFSLKNQHMEEYIGREKDPLLGHTFGAGMYSPDMSPNQDCLIGTTKKQINASIFVETRFTDYAEELADSLDSLYEHYGNESLGSYAAHEESWRSFWEQSYVVVTGDEQAEKITKAFLYQRYMTHCSDRGNAPMKFNGLLFTADQMDGYPGNYDARRWGAPYWFQNTRIMYWYLLYMGDYGSMIPFFDMYLNMIPIARARCEIYFGHSGILIPETVSHFGLYANSNYGFEDENGVRRGEGGKALRRGEPCNGYIRYHYNGMLELSYMMLKYMDLSGDMSRKELMLEFIEQVLLFFDRHFERFNGKMVMTPVSSLETWQMCVNDAPDVAGLRAVCEKLNTMSDIPPTLMSLVDSVLPAIPELPVENTDDGIILAPCEIKIFPRAQNVENCALYAVFPYELYGLGKDGLDIARRTYDKRPYRHNGGWSQDPVDAALLGLESETVEHLIRQSGMTDKRALFPAFWGPNFDETPDQDHGGMTSLCLRLALLQTDGDKYEPFPVWPEKWDAEFRLPLKHGVCVCGKQVGGQRTVWEECT
ncbi:MAG: hypothetical protein J6A83_02975 [Clostridia bacterium]|nr:hypothetical protein [Clostridia bacterium]